MKSLIILCKIALLLPLLLVYSPLLVASDDTPAATVAALAGSVTAASADDITLRNLYQNAHVFIQDTVVTGANSRARLVFTDGGALTLRPTSRLLIDAYAYLGNPDTDTQAKRLIRGGLRTVTGAIADTRPESYTLETPIATIGIRGTDFSVRYCRGDCIDLQDMGVAPPPDGLYVHVLAGRLTVNGRLINAGEAVYIDLAGIIYLLPAPPPILTQDPELSSSPLEDAADAAESARILQAVTAAPVLIQLEGGDFLIPTRQRSEIVLECPRI